MNRTNVWVNRIEVRSETSNRVYVVSQHAVKRHWGCSCPSWRTRRRCKHLKQLGLPGGEVSFEVGKDHGRKKGFLAGYATYDTDAGHGSAAEWQRTFAARMDLEEARRTLDLPDRAGWDDVRAAVNLARTANVSRLVAELEAAVQAFDSPAANADQAEAVRTAKFRVEAYAAYLEEQRRILDGAVERIIGDLLARIRTP